MLYIGVCVCVCVCVYGSPHQPESMLYYLSEWEQTLPELSRF